MDVAGKADFAAVTCADHNMLGAACCVLLSVRDNIDVPCRLFLVALDMSGADAKDVAEFSERHQLNIEVIGFNSDLLPKISRGRWSPSVLARLFLDQIIPPDVKRLLYLDADTLAVDRLDALQRIGFMGKPVAAVDDFIMAFPRKLKKRREKIGLGPESAYFNSGVLLFDWPHSLKFDLFRAARHKLETCSDSYHATDQDALNATLDGKWLRLSPRWNAQTGFLREISAPAILHFTGRRKPWQKQASWLHRRYIRRYRDYLTGTRWDLGPRSGMLEVVTSFLLYVGKSLEGLRKASRLKRYVNRSDGKSIWKSGDE